MSAPDEDSGELPDAVIDEAVRLTRLARQAVDPEETGAYRDDRDDLLDGHGYAARVREDDGRPVLVCYPSDWIEDGTVQVDRIEDVDRGVERPLAGERDADWESIAAHNRSLATTVKREHGQPHGATANALAAFANNHYARRIERLPAEALAEFRTEYFPRNAWPNEAQREHLGESIEVIYAAAGTDPPVTDR